MLRLLRRSNSNRSNCSSETVVIPNANHDRGGCADDDTTTTAAATNGGGHAAANRSSSNSSSSGSNRYSMVESCPPPSASTRAKDLEQHRRYRPHSQARRLRKTRQVRILYVCTSY